MKIKKILNLKLFLQNFNKFNFKFFVMRNSGRRSGSKSKKKIELKFDELEDKNLDQENSINESDEEYEIKRNNISSKKKTPTKSKLDLLKNFENENPIEESESEGEKNNILKLKETKSPRSKTAQTPEKRTPPKDFQKIWDLIESMRGDQQAPVDTYGAEFCCDPKQSDRKTYKFQSLISVLLSSQTKDPITFATMERLINHGLTVENIIQTEEDTLRDLIYGVSFHNNKAKFIKKLAQILKEKYDSDPPEDLQELLSLPGIGPKMAHIYLQFCCGKIEGIAVDTHVHRIANRLKWATETKTPEHTRKELESWVPKEKWSDINLLLVGFGQTICAAVAPKCQQCKLNKICEFGKERLKILNEKKSKSRSKSREGIEKKLKDEEKEEVLETPSKVKRKSSPIKPSTGKKNKK
jgi:endonuclease III